MIVVYHDWDGFKRDNGVWHVRLTSKSHILKTGSACAVIFLIRKNILYQHLCKVVAGDFSQIQ
jgi:hypothetical protein